MAELPNPTADDERLSFSRLLFSFKLCEDDSATKKESFRKTKFFRSFYELFF